MDAARRLSNHLQQLMRPGHVGDAGSMFPAAFSAGPVGGMSLAPCYTTWSGTSATTHRRFILGMASHGIGAELN